MKVLCLAALTAFGAFTSLCYAQDKDDRIPVRVTAECEGDLVGERLVYRTREEVRSSRRMKEETDYIQSVVQVRFLCLDPRPEDAGVLTKYSYVITAMNTGGTYDYLVGSVVGECGSSRVTSCAEGVVAKIDNALDDLIETVRKGQLKFKE